MQAQRGTVMHAHAVGLKADGVDLVVGLVETHGRGETAALLEGLEILPRRRVAHRGRMLEEFDLDAALERRPRIVIVDEQQRPQGIFTLRDLRRVIADACADLGQSIAELMTQEPFHLPPDASAFDAAIAMTERHIAHVCVVDDGRLRGVVSERDLFSLQRVDLVHLARTIRHAGRVETLAALRNDIQRLVDSMLAHGASSTQITHIITLLNDHTVCRVIELAIEALGDPGLPFTWLCFGSEGRREQTLHTDQDNGILFEARDAAEAAAI
eukprot:gene47493-58180_t